MGEPLRYLLTWTTYGTWIRGDARGWVDKRRACPGMPYEMPDPARVALNQARMAESSVILLPETRKTIAAALEETCGIKKWQLHEIRVLSNHVHAVVTAPQTSPEHVMKILKEWGTRTLNRLYPGTSLPILGIFCARHATSQRAALRMVQ